MLLKCCLIILIMFHKINFFCDAGEEYEGNNDAKSSTANYSKLVCADTNATRILRRNGNKEKLTINPLLILPPNATANREKLKGHKDRFLTKHFAVTCDGYILKIFRLSFEQNKAITKHRPVLLVPGMFQSSDRFLAQSENQSLAFRLQDLGYDVWLGNVRGNKYSRHHLHFEPESDEKTDFFNYSFEEIGYYDIAAIVHFIRNTTDFKKIHYIGHSLGGTAFLILNSLRPQYNSVFDKAFLLAPLAYQRYFPHNELKRDIYHLERTYEELVKAGIVEIFPYDSIKGNNFLPDNCLGDKKYENICNLLAIQKVMGLSNKNNTWENTRGGSIKQLIHLAQNIHSGTFSRWFYKEQEDNQKHYGRKSPPEYDLSLITVPTTIFYSAGDEYVARRDIETLAKKMDKAKTRKVARNKFRHDDFITAPDVMHHVYSHILNELPENPNPDISSISTVITEAKNDKGKTPFKFFPTGLIILIFAGGVCIYIGVNLVKKLNKSETGHNEEPQD